MEGMNECPVCGGRVTSLNSHMASHSKEDIVAALLRQQSLPTIQPHGLHVMPGSSNSDFANGRIVCQPPQPSSSSSLSFNPIAQSQPVSLVKKSTADGTIMTSPHSQMPAFDMSLLPSTAAAGPFLMPQMMGMMQVISPCFIPQPNGPPILVNLPSYIYPNIGMMGGMLAAAGTSTSGPLTSSASHFLSASSTTTTTATTSNAGFSFVPTLSNVPSLPSNLLPQHPVSFASASSPINSLVEVTVTPSLVVHSRPSSVVMDLGTSSDDSVISVEDHKDASGLVNSLKQRSESQAGPSGLNLNHSSKSEPKLLPNERTDSPIKIEHEESRSLASSTKEKKKSVVDSVFGCTRYASDSPYPAASINFASVLNMEEQLSTVNYKTEDDEVEGNDYDNDQSSKPSPEYHTIKDECDSPNGSNYEGSNICTVHTVTDLHNALKSEEDIQIVVPNELLETVEFKTFLSNLGPFPITSSSSSSGFGLELTPSAERVCHAPPNTPSVTRPPSTAPLSPQPCSSRDLSRSGFSDPPPTDQSEFKSDNSDEGDDITLQDLVAMETMEDDICDDDHFFQMSSNPLEPFMNTMLHHEDEDEDEENVFSCHKCGLHYSSFGEFSRHKMACTKRRTNASSKGVIGKKSSKKSSKTSPTTIHRPHPITIDPLDDSMNANLDPISVAKWQQTSSVSMLDLVTIKSEQSSVLSSADLIPNNSNSAATVKSETFDSSSQPALGAAGANHWKCNQCRVVFESGPLLWEHIDSINTAIQKCSICHLIFDERKQALSHRKKFHPSLSKIKLEPPEMSIPNENGEFVCDKCDRAFKDRDLLTKHQSCHDEANPWECLECGKKFSKGSLLRNHRRRHFEVGAFECQLCKKRFYTPNKLREHERVHTGEAPLSCNVCGKTFKRHSNLSEHKRIHLDVRPVKPPKELFCHCGKVFPTQRDLDWHKEGEHDNVPKKCTYCGEIFVHSSSLTRHIRLKHKSDFMPTDKKSTLYANCPICQQTFYKTSITKHIRIKHHGQKPFKCDVCKLTFVTKCNLINHMWQHKGVRARPFKCQQCNKSYLRQSLLEAHMRSHRGVKPFVCNECGLQFANKSNWQRHVAEHSGTRNYPCHLCDKRFSRNYYLSDHLKTHTGEKPFVCGICGKSAATRSNYNSHLRTHITREPVNSEV